MTSEQFIKIRNLIEKEFSHAVTKHPKFCDHFIDESSVSWAEAETRIKAHNSQPPEYADCVLMEEIAEAFNAYSRGELEHSLQEFAQIGAVVMRCMGFVIQKLEQEKQTKMEKAKRNG
jgi:NTP pyrophosphatase (non-canonical NTP hydrolase)